MKKFAATLVAAAALLALAPAAAADTEDQRFFQALDNLGFVVTNASTALEHGNMICNEGLAHGVTWAEMHDTMMQWGYSHDAASVLAIAAIDTKCPEYSALRDQIAENI